MEKIGYFKHNLYERILEESVVGTINSPFIYNFREICKAEVPNTTYATHGIHSYPAKFIPQIPHFFIRTCTKKGETVLDPFCGSGTTLVEAQILGRNSVGVDINPLARVITKAKVTPIEPQKLRAETELLVQKIQNYKNTPPEIDFPNKKYWFDEKVLHDLYIIKACIDEIENEKIRDFFLVCFSSIIRKVSKADPNIWQPLITKKMRKILSQGRYINTISIFERTLQEGVQRMTEFYSLCSEYAKTDQVKAEVIEGDYRNLQMKRKVQLIVTSPPFINAHEYIRTHKLEMFWLGLVTAEELRKLQKDIIGPEVVPKKEYEDFHEFGLEELDKIMTKIYEVDPKRAYIVYKFFIDMKKCLNNCYNTLDDERYLCITIGDNTIRGVFIPTHKFIVDIATDLGFKVKSIGIDEIKSRALSTKRHFTDKYMDVEWILLFKKS